MSCAVLTDGDVTHVEGRIDPLSDIATIETELMLADLESLERRIAPMEKKAKGGDKDAKDLMALAEKSLAELREGRPARAAGVGRGERRLFQSLGLLSSKPVLYVCNVDEASADQGNAYSDQVKEQAAKEGAAAVIVSAKIESEIAVLPESEQKAYLEAIGLTEPGLSRVIRAGYALLHLITFFTAGPKEARAWTVEQGTKAPQAAGVIHTDFEKGFIRAETIAYDDYVAQPRRSGRARGGQIPARRQGLWGRRRRRHAFPLRQLSGMPDALHFRGLSFRRGRRIRRARPSASDIVAFAREFDPQPFHLDEEAARAAAGGLIASGWHTSALLLRMNCEAFLVRAAILDEAGVEEVRWMLPVGPPEPSHRSPQG